MYDFLKKITKIIITDNCNMRTSLKKLTQIITDN